MDNDPNGYGWHEPKCPECGRFDANCKCDWPMPKPPPYPAADDEGKAETAEEHYIRTCTGDAGKADHDA